MITGQVADSHPYQILICAHLESEIQYEIKKNLKTIFTITFKSLLSKAINIFVYLFNANSIDL